MGINSKRIGETMVKQIGAGRAVQLIKSCGMILLGIGGLFTSIGMTCNGQPLLTPDDPVLADMLAPAPQQPTGFYDYFGSLKTPTEARAMVADAELDASVPSNYDRVGLVKITEKLIERGRDVFFNQSLGDPSTLLNLLSFGSAFGKSGLQIVGDSYSPDGDPEGVLSFIRDLAFASLLSGSEPTTNLRVRLFRDLIIGSQTFPAGSWMDTGLDIPRGGLIPVGFEGGVLSCALCHAAVDPVTGERIDGAPNTDLNVSLFLALSPNNTAGFLRFDQSELDPLDPKFSRTGRTIIDSNGDSVQLPDPIEFERAVDDFILSIPMGSFEAAPDGTAAITKIPDAFTFGEGGMGWDGGFQVGPFGGVAAFSNAVHAVEINVLGPAAISEVVAGIDPEVYLGLVLQNAPDPALRVPDGVKPSQWLAENAPGIERRFLVELPSFPNFSLMSINGLMFSRPGEPFMHAVNAMAAYQNSLTVPANRSGDNFTAIESGAVLRGAEVFNAAGCNSCHTPPYYTNGEIISNDVLEANAARGRNRFTFRDRVVDSVIYAFDQMVPLANDAVTLQVPPAPGTADNLSQPSPLEQNAGGYKVIGLLGTYLKAPYLHDGGVAVAADALRIAADGSYTVINSESLGVPGTLQQGRHADAYNSLRALLDRDLRQMVVDRNRADADLQRVNVEGCGHHFWVDPQGGFSYQDQSDLIDFLMALDDHPGAF